jgi:hypothetical protein
MVQQENEPSVRLQHAGDFTDCGAHLDYVFENKACHRCIEGFVCEGQR